MWNNKFIESQLKFRLKPLAKITTERHPFTGGNFTQFYKYKDKKLLVYNYKPNGTLIGNFVISDLVRNDLKGAVEFGSRTGSGTWGKRLVIDKCGESDMERLNYISELMFDVIKSIKE